MGKVKVKRKAIGNSLESLVMEMEWTASSDGTHHALQDDAPYGYAQGNSRGVMKDL